MGSNQFRSSVKGLLIVIGIAASTATAIAQGGLKTINPPQGGKIMYGQVEGQTTEAGAMAYILRHLHTELKDRPQVGKLFQVHGTESVAAFFSVNRKDQASGQPRQIAGLIIATKVTTDHVEAALVSDDAARFPKTLQPMMKTLFAAWHPLQGASSGGSGSGPAALHQVVLQDRSASIGLPDGWQLVPNMSMGGSIVATGPRGETAEMNVGALVGDTNNPTVQRTLQTLRNGGLRNTMYAKAIYYPYGADAAKTFVYVMQSMRQRAGLSQATYNFTSVRPAPSSGQERCAELEGTADMNNGSGPRELTSVFCITHPGRFGSYVATANTTMAPVKIAAQERATLGAIMASFNVNQQVVSDEAHRISQPEIDRIHAIGAAAANAAKQAHEREDIQRSSVYNHWDSMDKRSQEFENYQLGYTVISTTDHSAHGTFWNQDADDLVKGNPDKFEYVSAPDYWKGIDY
jgi:hypothetical protein